MRRTFVTRALKLILVGGFLYFLMQRGLLSVAASRAAFAHWEFLLLALVATIAVVGLSALRWQILLRAQGFAISYARTFQLGMIGNFFNLALPGGMSGDVLKAFYVGKEKGPGSLGRAMASMVADRISGLSALVLVAAGSLGVGSRSFGSDPHFAAIRWFVLAAALAVVALYAYVVCVREASDPFLVLLNRAGERWSRLTPMVRFYEGIRCYHRKRGALLGTLLLSVGIHLASGWACFYVALALGETELVFASVLLVFVLGTLVNVFPLAPAGIGTGHGAFLYLFHLIGSNRGADVYSFLALFAIFSGALGGLLYLWKRGKVQAGVLSQGTVQPYCV